jgi:tetratricopeptide (TPR) repeat protein
VDEAMLPYLVEALEAQFDALTARLAMVVPVPVRVEVVGTLRGLAADAGIPEEDVRGSGVVAAARFNKLVIVTPSQVRWGYPYADTAAHELVHHFLTIRGGDRIPVWFQEAAARYLESLWRGGEAGVLHRGMRDLLASAAAQGRLIPLTTLRRSLARIGGMGETALAFAELSSFAAWLEREHGPTVLARLVDALASGDEDKAMARVTGATLAAASQAWSRELFQAGAPAGRSATPVRAVEQDREAASAIPPEVADDVRLGDLLAAEGRHLAAAVRYRKALAALPEPRPAVVARLATALVDGGENAAAVAALDEARLDEAEYPVLAGARGRALVALGRAREALSPLLDAARSDPYDPAVHAAMEAAFRAAGDLEAAERERRLAALWR